MPSFEFGVLEQVRDMALVMRLDFSRSQSQSTEHEALKIRTQLSPSQNSYSAKAALPTYYPTTIAIFYQTPRR